MMYAYQFALIINKPFLKLNHARKGAKMVFFLVGLKSIMLFAPAVVPCHEELFLQVS